MKLNKTVYYILSFTWGIIVSFAGMLFSAFLMICGFHPKKNSYGWVFEVGEGWGGFSAGPCAVVCKDATPHIYSHEFGHSIQNCLFGPFMIFLVIIPSIIRYWYREIKEIIDPPYDSIWFESQATRWGEVYHIRV